MLDNGAQGKHPTRFAVVMDWVFSLYQEDIKRGIDRYAREAGVEIVYVGVGSLSPSSLEDEAKGGFFDLVSGREFDGALIVSNVLVNTGGELRLKEWLESLGGLPMVSIGPSMIGEDSVSIDNAVGMRSIMEHLIGYHGYRSFAYVSGPEANAEAKARLDIFRSSLDTAGIPYGEECVFYGNFLPTAGEEAVDELMGRRALKPEVIVCANDLMALGAWTALKSRGISCPQDIAVTGFDDMQLMHVLSTQFTTVRQPFDELGYLASARLHAAIRGDRARSGGVVATRLVVRGSCGCVEIRPPSVDAVSAVRDSEIASLLEDARRIVRDKDLRQGTRDLCREWSGYVQRHMVAGMPVYEFEEILHKARAAVASGRADAHEEALINALRSTLLEDCAQSFFAMYLKEYLFSLRLRIAVDGLQAALSSEVNLPALAPLFESIARVCGATAFYVMRFTDPERPLSGSDVIYAYDESGNAWAPGPGSYFPRGRGSLAANMLTVEDRRFGYFVVTSDTALPSAYDFMRIRLSGIFRDHGIMSRIRQLNEEMSREIAARIDSERRLKEALELVEQLSVKDELTGLHNRRGFLNLAEQQVKLLRRNRSGFFVLYADLDGLKPINDTWGHGDGDLAIRTAGRVLRENLRDSDIVARLGGDEFTALVSQANPPSIDVILKRIADSCARASSELGKPWRVSLSIGHFFASPDCDFGIERMLELADAELYKEKQKKRSGRKEPN